MFESRRFGLNTDGARDNALAKETDPMDSTVLREFEWRGLLHQVTDETVDERLAERAVTLYCGFDPTSSSLQVGNLLPLMMMGFFRRHGHRPLALVGGATGLIGDPSGKDEERNLLGEEQLEAHRARIAEQIDRILGRAVEMHPETLGAAPSELGSGDVEMVDNADWMRGTSYVEFLRDVGKYFRVNKMINKESVRTRLDEREQGISYTEFSYMVLQAYDFLHLYDNYGCELQVGGSDQWGNITAGVDLVRKKLGETVYGVTAPLVTSSSGEKLGKTAGETVWLAEDETSPYEFYQYWRNRPDPDVAELLKMFTFLSREEIEALEGTIERGENRGEVQEKLAWEVTALVHGESEADRSKKTARRIREGSVEELDCADLDFVFEALPHAEKSREELDAGQLSLKGLFRDTGLQHSGSAAKRLIDQGGAYVGGERIEDAGYTVGAGDLVEGTNYIVLRSGKSNYGLVRVS